MLDCTISLEICAVSGFMNNVVRKALRVIIDQLGQLEKSCTYEAEKMMIADARVSLVRADYYDFHVNPKKKYKVPKTDFNYEC